MDPTSINYTSHEHVKQKYKDVAAEKFFRFAFDHPKQAKTYIVATAILFSPILMPTLSIAALSSWIIGVRSGYSLSESAKKVASLASVIFDFLVPAKFDLKQKSFEEGAVGPKKMATITYEGDLPVITLEGDDAQEDYHYNVGYDQGYLLADPMQKLLHKWLDSLLWIVVPDPKKVPQLIKQLKEKIPKEYIEEMEGIAAGFNEKMKESNSSKRVTLDKLLLLQLVPDILHSKAGNLEKLLKKEPVKDSIVGSLVPGPACTTILEKDSVTDEVVFGRNMDWPTLGVAGTYSIMVRRKFEDKTILEIGTPGLIGTITGMTSEGFALSMNVAEGKTQNINGLPASIFNRMCIENCATVGEVEEYIKDNPTLGAYHLTVATKDEGRVFDLYQGDDNAHYTRSLSAEKGPVVTTNCSYNESGMYKHHAHSKQREHNIATFYSSKKTKKMKTAERVQKALALPVVNNLETAHHAMMFPAQNKMFLAINNGYAGRDTRHEISVIEKD